MRNLVLAIDQGTTSTRCITFDPAGRKVHSTYKEFPQIYPQPGWVEHDPRDIFQSVVHCVNTLDLLPSDQISAVGITNQRETIVAWDRITGEPLSNAIVWLDTRTRDIVNSLATNSPLGVNRYRSITGLPLSTYFSSGKILWLIHNVPSVAAAVDSGTCCFGSIDSYLTWKLTGHKAHVTDCTNASRYNLMDLDKQAWSEQICSDLGIPVGALPRIVSNVQTVGHIDPAVLPALGNVPITSLIGDQHAALVGHGCMKPRQCKITYGTGAFLLMNTGLVPIQSASGGLLTTMAYQLGPRARPVYALEGSVAATGRSVEWAKDNLRIGHDLAEFNEIAASVPDTCGVTFVPAFSGLLAPYWRDDARAVIVGMSLRSSYRHIARSILEATAMQCVEVFRLIQEEAKTGPDEMDHIVTDGGMTKSDLLMQIQADLLAIPVQRARMTESTAFGAAYCAGLGVDFWKNQTIAEVISNHDGYTTFTPNMEADVREATFARWKDAVNRSLDLSRFSSP